MSDATTNLKKLNRVKLTFGFMISILVGVAMFMGLPSMLPYKIQICGIGATILCAIVCIMYAEKNKIVATVLALTLIAPMDLIYLDQVNLDEPVSLIVRCIPVVGNIYDLYRIYISKDLVPATGWSPNLF